MTTVINGTSYPFELSVFQKEILDEMSSLAHGGCLCLPMGSGKSMLSMYHYLHNYEKSGPMLVVCSLSLLNQWIGEAARMFPGVAVVAVHTSIKRQQDKMMAIARKTEFGYKEPLIIVTNVDSLRKNMSAHQLEMFIVTTVYSTRTRSNTVSYLTNARTHPLLRSASSSPPAKLEDLFYTTRFDMLAIDEGHAYFNLETKSAKALLGICAQRRWILTGTFMPSPHVKLLYGYFMQIFSDLVPTNFPEFMLAYSDNSSAFAPAKTMVTREVNDDFIPSKLDIKVHRQFITVPLSDTELHCFLNLKESVVEVYKQYTKDVRAMKMLDEQRYANERIVIKENRKYLQGLLLSLISYLRVSILSPYLAMTQIFLSLADMSSRKPLLMNLLDILLTDKLKAIVNDPDDGHYNAALQSTRIKKVIGLAHEKHAGDRVIIFSAFRTYLDQLSYHLKHHDESREVFVLKSGSTPLAREATIEKWRSSTNGILLLTYKIGCTGLNLQACPVVIINDFEWNHDATDQGIGRILRRGQTSKNIYIYYMTSNTGLERSVFSMHSFKRKYSASLVSGTSDVTETQRGTISLKTMVSIIDEEDNIQLLEELTSAPKKTPKDDPAIIIVDDDPIVIDDDPIIIDDDPIDDGDVIMVQEDSPSYNWEKSLSFEDAQVVRQILTEGGNFFDD